MAGLDDLGKGFDDLGKDLGKFSNLFVDLFETIKKHVKETSDEFKDLSKDLLDSFDDALGGVPGKVKDFITNPIGGAFTLLAGTMADLISQTDDLGKKFGAIGVTEFRDDILDARTETLELGRGFDSIVDTITELSDNFGVSVEKATEMAKDITDVSVALGMSNAEGSKLIGILSTGTGLTAEAAINLSKQTALLSKQEGLVPNVVMKDMAESSESVAKFVKQGGQNIAVAAIQARKLGTNLDTVAKIAEGLLDFESSITSELEASILIGRQLNFQRARQLALTGDLAGAMGEVVSQLGSEEEFNRLNVLQRDALAKSIGVGTDELAKFVKLQGKSVSQQMELTEMAFDELVSEDAISNITLLTNKIKAVGAALTATLASFTKMIGITGDSAPLWDGLKLAGIGLGVAILGIGVAALATGLKMKIMSMFLKDAAVGTGQFGISALSLVPVLLSVAAIAFSVGFAIKSVGFTIDKVAESLSGELVKNTFGMSIALAALSTSLLSVAGAGAIALPTLFALSALSSIGFDVTGVTGDETKSVHDEKVEKRMDMLQEEIVGLRKDMKTYFGFGGTALRGIGKETVRGIETAKGF